MKKAIILAVLLPIAAGGFYIMMDSGVSSVEQSQASAGAVAAIAPVNPVSASVPAKSLPTVGDMLGQLEDRLKSNPEDAKGWNLLGKSYEFMGRHDDAAQAFERARALGYVEENTDNSGAVVRSASVKGVVRLDPSLTDNVSITDTVFVFAKAVNGPRMPVAVLRKKAADIPFEFELDDTMAMSPEVKLSDFNNIIVGARISSSGDAIAAAGDFEGYSEAVNVAGSDEVTVLIGQSVIK